MTADREHAYLDSVTGFVLGTLSVDEEKQLLDHLAEGCALCEEALAKMEPMRLGLAASAPPSAPSAELKQRVLAAAQREGQEPGRETPRTSSHVTPIPVRTNRVAWAIAAALAIAVGVLSVASWRLRAQREDVRQRLAGVEQTLEGERNTHATDIASRDEYLDLLLDPRAVCIDFDATPDAPANLRGKATYDSVTRRAVIALNNAALPTTQDYELWAIRNGTPVSLGVIAQSGDGTATVLVVDVGPADGLAAFAVSLEPVGGSPQSTPTGDVVLLAPLGG